MFAVMARRSQTERSAATIASVLDATIECLVELGHARTSTRHIARRAGVTVGAVQHHYASKAELMAAALIALGDRLAEEFLAAAPPPGSASELERMEVLLDRLWAAHRGPLWDAGLELWVAARTDPELRAAMAEVTASFAAKVATGVLEQFPALVGRPAFVEQLVVGLATLRGVAMPGWVELASPEDLWALARPKLLASFAAVLDETPEP